MSEPTNDPEYRPSQDELRLLPADLPEDVRASYKPQSLMLQQAVEEAKNPRAKRILDSQELSKWRVAYRDRGAARSLESRDSSADLDKSAIVLNRLIGQGGFGEVWEATQNSLGRAIAVKRMREDLFKGTVSTESMGELVELCFRQEALTAANLDHPNIVPVHDLGRDDKGRAILSMKLVRGRTWEDIIEEDWEVLSAPDFLAKHLPILIDMAQAVSFAHSRGIVHRDLKPSQVMVGDYGEVLLMDWGLAIVHDPALALIEGSTFITSGMAPVKEFATNPAGTLAFMSPEQTDKEADRLGPWTDVFLLGGTLYFLLTHTTPHTGSGNVATFFRAMQGNVQPPHLRAPNRFVPPELVALCAASLHPDPAQRMQSAGEFIVGLQSYLSGASRRQEALALQDEAFALIESATSYQSYGRAQLALERSLSLWPEHSRTHELAQRAATEFSRLALRNEDLLLARMQALRIEETATRDELLDLVDEKETHLHDSERQARFFRRVVGFTLGALVVVLGMNYMSGQQDYEESQLALSVETQRTLELREGNRLITEARNELQVSQEKSVEMARLATASRLQAEQISSLLVQELSDDLVEMGRISLLEASAVPLAEYYRELGDLGTGPHSHQARLNKAEALQLEALVMRLRGDGTLALERLEEARQLLEALRSEAPNDVRYPIELADLHLDIAATATLLGSLEDALQNAVRSRDIVRELREKSGSDDPKLIMLQARALHLNSLKLYMLGRPDEALVEFNQVDPLLDQVPYTTDNEDDLLELRARTKLASGVIDWEAGSADSGLDLIRTATELRSRLGVIEPWNLHNREATLEINTMEALVLIDLGRYAEGLEAINRSLETVAILGDIDGLNLRRTSDLIEAYLIRSLLEWREGNLTGAAQSARAARRSAESFRSEGTPPRILRYAAAQARIAEALYVGADDAVPLLEEAIRIYRSDLLPFDELSTRDLFWYTVALIKSGHSDEAKEALAAFGKRNARRRILYELAFDKGLVEESANYQIRVR